MQGFNHLASQTQITRIRGLDRDGVKQSDLRHDHTQIQMITLISKPRL